MTNIFELPIILVARGCLAPYFLDWWKRTAAPLHICDFSRWRWFEFGEAAKPRWIGTPPDKSRSIVLFDRNTTTGQTLRLLKKWLEVVGYKVVVLGHMDKKMGRFGLRYLNYVWDDSEGYDKLGLACQNQNGVRIVPVSEYKTELDGAYTFCVIGGWRAELNGVDGSEANVDIRSVAIPGKTSVVFQNVPSWEQAMLLGYVNQKPLITIAGSAGIVADYGPNDDLAEITDYLKEESE